jgi:hypothetical protein
MNRIAEAVVALVLVGVPAWAILCNEVGRPPV